MIGLERLTIARGSFQLAADATVEGNAITALIGPSGAGKSSLLDAIAGFLEPLSGRVTIGGSDMSGRPPAERPVSILFQDHNLFPHLSVAQNLALGLRPDLKLSDGEWRAVEEALHSVGLKGMAARYPGACSGGQRQRAALARALLRRRPVLLLDEPFSGLDPALRKDMLDLVGRLTSEHGLTVMMITHQPEDALRIAARTLLITGGELHGPWPTREAFKTPTAEMRAYLGE